MHDPLGLRSTRVYLFWRHARPGNATSHVKCDRSCHGACPPLFGRTPTTSGNFAGARLGATVAALDQGVLALAAWPAPRRQRIRIHRPAARPRHCWMVGHRFRSAKSRPQAHLREEDKGFRCPGYIYARPKCSSPTGGGREPAKAAQSKRHQGHGEGEG
jgi:hypothetical protein